MANPGGQFRLTKEESAVMDECRRNSFWYRAVPLMAVTTGILTYRRINLQMPPKYYGLKMAGAMLASYMIGKASYIGECRRLIVQRLPDSNLARTLESKQYDLISDMAQPPEIVPKNATTGIFGNRPEEGDDQFQVLNPMTEQTDKSATRRYVTYDELRDRSRTEFAAKMNPPKPRPDPPAVRPPKPDDRTLSPLPIVTEELPFPSPAVSKRTTVRKNQYGDEVYE